MKVLITGGSGFIGSHAVLALLNSGFEVVVVDNLSNSMTESLVRVEKLAKKRVIFHQYDINNVNALDKLFKIHEFDSVLHFAALKSVANSTLLPLDYYINNVSGTLALLDCMRKYNVFKFVFSSSATVYDPTATMPLTEESPVAVSKSPYGQTKVVIERALHDLAASDPRWKIAILRYFNPIGAHESGLIGEDPKGEPNNLVPYITQVAIGNLKELNVYGNDYPTKDGTGIRDYVHVQDLIEGHIAALCKLPNHQGVGVWNLGTGQGYSVLEILHTFEAITGKEIPFNFKPRRAGDVAVCYADPMKAEKDFNWRAKRSIAEMLEDSWRWQVNNPYGYRS